MYFVNRQMREAESGVARIAAGRLIDGNLKLAKPYGDVETTAKHSLKAARIIRSVGQPSSRINEILAYILKRKQTAYDWKAFFGAAHSHAERMTIFLKRNRESNIDAFLVQLDSWCDEVFSHIYSRRSEEHTSELQSLMRISYAVFCLKTKKQNKY